MGRFQETIGFKGKIEASYQQRYNAFGWKLILTFIKVIGIVLTMNTQNITKMLELIEQTASRELAADSHTGYMDILYCSSNHGEIFAAGVKDGETAFAQRLLKIFKGQ
jgi:hypothetical protein